MCAKYASACQNFPAREKRNVSLRVSPFLAGGDFRARSNIPENEGLLVVVEQPGTGCPRLSRVTIFPLALLSLKNRRQSVSG